MDAINWTEIVIATIGVLGLPLLALLGKALSRWADVLAAQSKLAFVARVDDFIMSFVTDVYHRWVRHAKAASADGKWTDAEKAEAKQEVVRAAQAHFGKLVGDMFGDSSSRILGAKVERAVAISKLEGRSGKAPLA